jgi:hypothetical protein
MDKRRLILKHAEGSVLRFRDFQREILAIVDRSGKHAAERATRGYSPLTSRGITMSGVNLARADDLLERIMGG